MTEPSPPSSPLFEVAPNSKEIKKGNTLNPNYQNLNSFNKKAELRKSIVEIEIDNLAKIIESEEKESTSTAPITYKEFLAKFEPLINSIGNFLLLIIPIISTVYVKINSVYKKLPMDIVYAIMGLMLAFFGGTFALSLVVIEAIYNTGFYDIRLMIGQLYDEIKYLWKKYNEENKSERWKTFIKDNKTESETYDIKSDFVTKVDFFFTHTKNPKKLMDLITCIGSTLITVFAVVHSKFAKSIALGSSIGEAFKRPSNYLFVPLLTSLYPKKYHQWIYPTINYTCKTIAIILSLILGKVISTVQSGIRGGLLFSRRILKWVSSNNYYKFDSEKNYLDEIIGWSIAAIGIFFQFRNKFSIPFPLNIIMLPLTLLEIILSCFFAYL